jgi:hypothetical protein
VQPSGYHARRAGGEAVKSKVVRAAQTLCEKKAISAIARDYLVGWASGARVRAKRPEQYSFLNQRPGALELPAGGLSRPPPRQVAAQRVEVRVRGAGGQPLPLAPADEANDAEPGELVERAADAADVSAGAER